MKSLSKAYSAFYYRMKQINKSLEMNKQEFIDWWHNTGHLHERGPGPDQYCMALIDHTKPYSTNNIKCIKNRDRWNEITLVKGKPVITPFGDFPDIESAHKVLHKERRTIKHYCAQNKPGWSYK